ncbi:NAD(P)H-dependent oxidoreductase [Jannaschia formosa]|uniref:NAD(P)H-dependent oxidoreductase n=1 Tax=Jannaschia formosa TaxID=2259592 RepID=UPI000E1B6DF9|nr:NAD(P)H-dependent oxidoreductase [Jannaschia formosa]TFL19368.1 flavodoxin family protein [Jannaschia formosa]
MRALVIHCHPKPDSFAAAVRDSVTDTLRRGGAEIRLRDLYAEGFQPVLTEAEWSGYLDSPANRDPVADHVADLQWCDTLIFVYPTWWYGLPAMLKGWLDRVLLPDVAFLMPEGPGETIRPGLRHIERLGVFTTCGASRWLTFLVGAPGKRTLMRGVGLLLKPRHRRVFAAYYLMDSATRPALEAHLARVADKTARLIGAPTQATEAPAE